MNLYKAAYPFVQGLELAAVQIIAVDTVQKSGSHIAGYLSEAGKPIQNTVSTGDLNRGRRTKSRLLFGSFCRSKKNKLVPFRELPDKQEVCPCRAARCACFSTACGGYACCCRNNRAAARRFTGRRGVPICTRKACTNTPRFRVNRSLASQAF